MSLFGSLYTGVSGLRTSQNALNTTAHNLSNIDTIGYTRQQVQQGTRFYNKIGVAAISPKQIGLGVEYTRVKQIRDAFLDKNYRRELGRSAYYEIASGAIEEVEALFKELDGDAFAASIDNLWRAVQDLAEDPSNPVDQGVFMQRCNEFLSRGQAVYSGLCEYQNNLNYKIAQQVETMNAYAKRIAELNQEIMGIESGNVEWANDLKDERNLLLDELSAMGNIECRTDSFGNVLIKLEGVDFVKMDSANEILLHEDTETGFYTPYWKQLAKKNTVNGVETLDLSTAAVFDLGQVIATDRDTDIGSLKSMMFARGNKRATFKDLGMDGNITGSENPGSVEYYDKYVSQSVVMNVQAEFDMLVHSITLRINEVFKEAADRAEAEQPGTDYMKKWIVDANGNPVLDNNGKPTWEAIAIFRTQIDSMNPDDFTIENLIIDGELKQSPSLLGFKKDDGQVDQTTADALKAIFKEEKYKVNPHVNTACDFINYYNNLVSLTANFGYVLRGICSNQEVAVDNTAAAREQVHGVSSDEELSNMIMFQNAYNASSRYVNVINEMLEHVLSALGR
ncbi:MAG: flagellar hook-associated protein FlgK [Lachnospiraceae bacterium]|jgi:flagellar hook-associated protein 1 FlgK|nr:flagellar hook-associated protein FlgK [Lachnospiraceae bacterium]GFI16840.1 flagellar hook-associated protein 1 [Lachnospiraceae bacterium]